MPPSTAPPTVASSTPSYQGLLVHTLVTTCETKPTAAPIAAPIAAKNQKSPSVSTLFTGSFSQYENTFLS